MKGRMRKHSPQQFHTFFSTFTASTWLNWTSGSQKLPISNNFWYEAWICEEQYKGWVSFSLFISIWMLLGRPDQSGMKSKQSVNVKMVNPLKLHYKANIFAVAQANQRGRTQREEPSAVMVITGVFKGKPVFHPLFSASDWHHIHTVWSFTLTPHSSSETMASYR